MIEKTKFPLFSDKFHAGKYEHVWLTVPLAKIRTIPQINRNFPKFHNSDLDFQKSYVDFQKIEVEETHKKKEYKNIPFRGDSDTFSCRVESDTESMIFRAHPTMLTWISQKSD